jgi:hypothetical protein
MYICTTVHMLNIYFLWLPYYFHSSKNCHNKSLIYFNGCVTILTFCNNTVLLLALIHTYVLFQYLIKVNEIKTKKGIELLQHLVEYYHAQTK